MTCLSFTYDHLFHQCACNLNAALILPLVCMKLNAAVFFFFLIISGNFSKGKSCH